MITPARRGFAIPRETNRTGIEFPNSSISRDEPGNV